MKTIDVFVQVAARFDGFDLSATVSMRMFPFQQVILHGEKGILRLTCPFNPTVYSQAELHLETTQNSTTVERFPGVNHYVQQVENFGASVTEGAAYPCPLEFSRGTQRMTDMAFAAGG